MMALVRLTLPMRLLLVRPSHPRLRHSQQGPFKVRHGNFLRREKLGTNHFSADRSIKHNTAKFHGNINQMSKMEEVQGLGEW